MNLSLILAGAKLANPGALWLLIAVGVNVFVPQLEKVAEDVSVPLSPTDAPSVTGMKHIGEKFKEYDSDNLVLVTLVGDKPLGQDAHRYYDDLVIKLKQDTEHVEHALNFWGQRFTSSGVESYDHKAAYVQVNLRGDHVRRADRAETGIVDERDHLFDVVPGNSHLREGGHSLKILEPMFDAIFDIAVGLLDRFGRVTQADETPF